MNEAILLWLIWTPLAAAPLTYLVGRWHRPMAGPLALSAMLITWVPFVRTVPMLAETTLTYQLGAVGLHLDGFALLLTAVVLGLTTLVLLYSIAYMAGEAGEEKYYAMILAMTGVIIGLACAADLFNLWLWFEAMAVTSYLLVAFYRDRPASLEAGVKYLLQSATGSAFILFAIALVLAQTGTLDLLLIREVAESSPLLWVAGALFVVGFGVKSALVPWHTWLPDAHGEAPSGVSALLSGVVIEAGLLALLRVLTALAGITTVWGVLLMGMGVLNMMVGNLLALRQVQVKRLLAFSTVAHMGYMVFGMGIAVYAGEVAGAQGGSFHLLSHGLMKGLAFMAVGALLYALQTAEHNPLEIVDMAGAAHRYPLVVLTMSLAVLGLAGLPPLVGFASKWQILAAGFATQDTLVYGLVVLAALNSVLSLAYYAPLVNVAYRQQPSRVVAHGRLLPLTMKAPLLLLALAVVAIGVWPNLVWGLVEPAGMALTDLFGG